MSNYNVPQNSEFAGKRTLEIHFNRSLVPGQSWVLAYLGVFTNLSFTEYGKATPRALVLLLDTENVIHQFDAKYTMASVLNFAQPGDIMRVDVTSYTSKVYKKEFTSLRPYLVISGGCVLNDPKAEGFKVPDGYVLADEKTRQKAIDSALESLGNKAEEREKTLKTWGGWLDLDRTPIDAPAPKSSADSNPSQMDTEAEAQALERLQEMEDNLESLGREIQRLEGIAGKKTQVDKMKKEAEKLRQEIADLQYQIDTHDFPG